MKHFFSIGILALTLLVFMGTFFTPLNKPTNNIFETPLRKFSSKVTTIEIAIADNQETRRIGLSNLKSLTRKHGLLFVFAYSKKHGIWMKDMNFPIDIIWLNKDLQVVDIHKNISEDTYPVVFRPRVPAKFVLEVNAGFSQKYNVEIGDSYSLDAF